MREPPCGSVDCPIVDPDDIDRRRLRVHVVPAGTEWHRVARRIHGERPFAPPGSGSGRFSPLDGRGHAYVAAQRSAALLESVLHEAAGPNPRIYAARLDPFAMFRVRLVADAHIVDLRDDVLTGLGIDRSQLTGATARHYPCSRAVAERLAGAKGTVGFVWTSRQGHLHADRNRDGLAAEVLHHERLDVAVLYEPDAAGLVDVVGAEPVSEGGRPVRFVVELANLLRIAVL